MADVEMSDSGHSPAGGIHPSAVIADALRTPPNASTLGALSSIEPLDLPAGLQVDFLVALDRHASWLAALRLRAVAAVAGDEPTEEFIEDPFMVVDPVREEISTALRISNFAADKSISLARSLRSKLLATEEKLATGEITFAHAAALSEECERLSASEAAQVEQIVLLGAGSKTPGQLRRHARRVAARIAPLPIADQAEAEFAKREVRMFNDGGVMATIEAVLPAPDAIAVWNALTACGLADTHAHDARTLAHRRADALTTWAQRAAEDPGLPTHQGRRRLETQVVVDLPTLLGLADNPGELVGFGPIPASLARQLAADSKWRRLVTDPVTGHLLDFGRRTYSPPTALRDYIVARDRTCRFPGCSQPAFRTDLDHTVAFGEDASGGSTAAANLHCLCRRHHKLKTHHSWNVVADTGPSDRLTWTSPRGKRYVSHPPPQLDQPGHFDQPGNVDRPRQMSPPTEFGWTDLEVELRELLIST